MRNGAAFAGTRVALKGVINVMMNEKYWPDRQNDFKNGSGAQTYKEDGVLAQGAGLHVI
jgi:hypothetical protein